MASLLCPISLTLSVRLTDQLCTEENHFVNTIRETTSRMRPTIQTNGRKKRQNEQSFSYQGLGMIENGGYSTSYVLMNNILGVNVDE